MNCTKFAFLVLGVLMESNSRIVSPKKDFLSHEEAQRKSYTLFLLVRVEATFPYNLVMLLYSLVTSVRLEVCCCILKNVQQEICWPTFIGNLWMVVYVKRLFSLILFCFYVLLVIFFELCYIKVLITLYNSALQFMRTFCLVWFLFTLHKYLRILVKGFWFKL